MSLLSWVTFWCIKLDSDRFPSSVEAVKNMQQFNKVIQLIFFLSFPTELFEVGPRPVAMSMGSLSSWFCNFMIGMTFPTLQKLMGASVFLIFATVCVMLTVFLKFYMPETRGKDTAEVAERVADGFRSRPLEMKSESLNGF